MTATTLPDMPNYGEPPVSLRVAAPGLHCTDADALIRWDGPPLSLTIARRIDRHLYVMAEAEPGGSHPRLFAAGAGGSAAIAIAAALDAMADKLEPAAFACEREMPAAGTAVKMEPVT